MSDAARIDSFPAFEVAQSFSGRRWRLRERDAAAERALQLSSNVSSVLAQLLAARGVDAEDATDYLNPTLRQLLPEPFLLKDMERAVARVRQALDRGEKIAVFGDYDVDGSCSAALMHEFLSAIGSTPRVYIPDRKTEGYGPSPQAMLRLKDEGASLIVTVDCGATAIAALEAARDAGIDVIVLDHHAVDSSVPAFAQVNPNQNGDTSGLTYLCAAGVTFLFLVALNRSLRDSGWYAARAVTPPPLMDMLDLVGLATICDVVPLVGLNRAVARAGLAQLGALKRPGFAALARVADIAPPFTPYHLGFVFGPRINAGGRVGRCSLGVELLTAQDSAIADSHAQILDIHNQERRAIETLILEEAVAMAGAQHSAPFLLAAKEGWHPGVVGIVAGRLKDSFGKPSFVAGFEGGLGRGSARSVSGVDVGAIMRAAKEADVIESGGGHAMAAGFSLMQDQLETFTRFLTEQFKGQYTALAAASNLDLDFAIAPSGVTADLAQEIERIGPFGAGNPEPLALLCDVQVAFAETVGKDHVRLRLIGGDGSAVNAIAFRQAERPLGQHLLQSRGKRVHVTGRLRRDEWNGQTRVQLQVEDAAAAEA